MSGAFATDDGGRATQYKRYEVVRVVEDCSNCNVRGVLLYSLVFVLLIEVHI